MDYTHKFDGRAADYAAARPSYAEGLFDCLFERYGLAAGIPVADVGAGTGLFTEQLLKRGCIVYAVEPNEDMRHEAESHLSMYGGFISVAGDAVVRVWRIIRSIWSRRRKLFIGLTVRRFAVSVAAFWCGMVKLSLYIIAMSARLCRMRWLLLPNGFVRILSEEAVG